MSLPSEGSFVSGRRSVAEAIRSGRARELLVAEGARATQGMREVLTQAGEAGLEVREVPRRQLDERAKDHQGVVARVAPTRRLSERELGAWPFEPDAVVVVLDGVTDPQNLGAAARSAEAVGSAMLITRVRRAAPVTAAAVTASSGALLHLPHAHVANIPRALDRLADRGFSVVGLDDAAGSSIYDDACPSGPVAVVVGSEGEGMARLTRERCDTLVALPMHGRVASLNASASLAAVLYAYVLPSRVRSQAGADGGRAPSA
ncbi:MAG: 23S rRNA (guanosine(2251)-2'-O)-methyltransferase RlmB [Actinomycetota bacterium]